MTKRYPLHLHLLLLAPARVDAALERIREAGIVPETPTLWQIALGVLRMQHRLIFRSETIGTCRTHPVRSTWRARLLQRRPLRFPFLLAERAVAPLDMSGLLSSPERVLAHLLGAHHDGSQFAYDLEMLRAHPGWLERVRDAARDVVESDGARAEWLRDLCVFEGYHDALLAAAERAVAGDFGLDTREADDPDISFVAYLRWCAAQPATPGETIAAWRAGTWSIERGWVASAEAVAC